MKSIEENKDWIWLSSLNIRRSSILKLLEKFSAPETLYRLESTAIENEKYLTEYEKKQLTSKEYKKKLYSYIQYMNEKGINIILAGDIEYPRKLYNINDKPLWLYCIGDIKALKKKSVAIIGSRQCTDYGRHIARYISKGISNKGICIISGLATGIDTEAHLGCMEGSTPTIAVLGSRYGYYLSKK